MGKSRKKITPNPMLLWDNMTEDLKSRIIKNVYCVKCAGMTEIKDFTFHPAGKSLVLRGKCAKCGHEAARVLEGE